MVKRLFFVMSLMVSCIASVGAVESVGSAHNHVVEHAQTTAVPNDVPVPSASLAASAGHAVAGAIYEPKFEIAAHESDVAYKAVAFALLLGLIVSAAMLIYRGIRDHTMAKLEKLHQEEAIQAQACHSCAGTTGLYAITEPEPSDAVPHDHKIVQEVDAAAMTTALMASLSANPDQALNAELGAETAQKVASAVSAAQERKGVIEGGVPALAGDDVDLAELERIAIKFYQGVQEASNERNVKLIAQRLAPAMLSIIKHEFAIRRSKETTKVLDLHAELKFVRGAKKGGKMCSVHYTGMSQSGNQELCPINEVWYFIKVKPKAPWLLSGIESPEAEAA